MAQHATQVASTVRLLADAADQLSVNADAGDPEVGRLAETIDLLARHAQTVASQIELSARAACQLPPTPTAVPLVASPLKITATWTATLEPILETAVMLYIQLCSALADRASLAEEYLDAGESATTGRVTAAEIATHARKLHNA